MHDHRITLSATNVTTAPTLPARPRVHPAHLPPALLDPDSSFQQIRNVSVHYKLYKSPMSSSLLLCLHGFGASNFSFAPFQPTIQEMLPKLSLLAYDAPGFGLTSRPSSLQLGKYSSRFSASIAASFTEKFALPTSLLGHSLGSIAAISAVIADPGRYDALILVAPALLPSGSPLPKPLQTALRSFLSLLTFLTVMASVLLNPIFVLLIRRLVRADSFWRNGLALARTSPLPDYIVDGYKKPMGAPRWEIGVINFTRAAFLERVRGLNKREDLLQQYAARPDAPPVLIIHGENDRVVPLSNSKTLTELLPNAELVVMKDCGHVPHEEQPVRFAEIVKRFLEQVQSAKRDEQPQTTGLGKADM